METTVDGEMGNIPSGISLNAEAQNHLRESGKWASFLGLTGFILTGLILIGALSANVAISALSKDIPEDPGLGAIASMSGFLNVVYLLGALVYFFFSLYLYQFGVQIKRGLTYSDSFYITRALGKLKSYFKLWGMVTIVYLCLIVLTIVGLIIFRFTIPH